MLHSVSSKPLYQQLKEDLVRRIIAQELKEGERIPSERDLCEEYNVSRITVREAIREAVKEGYLQRVHGKGTFVSQSKIEQGLPKVDSFEYTLAKRGLKGRTKVLEVKEFPADFQIAKILNVEPAEQVLNIKLLGLADDEPMVVYNSYLPLELGRQIAKEAYIREEKGQPFSTLDLYCAVDGVIPFQSQQTFEAVTANRTKAKLLNVKEGVPLFLITSLIEDTIGRIVEFKQASYRGDRYKFFITRLIKG